jgi:preprotein translocase subunit SecE
MLNFFYDSLEVVKQLKHPTKKQYINLSIAIFLAIVIGGLLFIGLDSAFQGLYRVFHAIMGA